MPFERAAALMRQMFAGEIVELAEKLKKFSVVTEASCISVIGAENTDVPFQSTSLVASTYGPEDALSSLGVVGPTRMDYPSTMAAVRAVARYVGRFLAEG